MIYWIYGHGGIYYKHGILFICMVYDQFLKYDKRMVLLYGLWFMVVECSFEHINVYYGLKNMVHDQFVLDGFHALPISFVVTMPGSI